MFSGVSSLTPPGAFWYLLRWRWPRWPRTALWAGGMTSAELVAGLWRKQQRESTLWSSSQLSLLTQGCIGVWWACTPEEEAPDSPCPRLSPSGRRESPSTWRQKVRLQSHMGWDYWNAPVWAIVTHELWTCWEGYEVVCFRCLLRTGNTCCGSCAGAASV